MSLCYTYNCKPENAFSRATIRVYLGVHSAEDIHLDLRLVDPLRRITHGKLILLQTFSEPIGLSTSWLVAYGGQPSYKSSWRFLFTYQCGLST